MIPPKRDVLDEHPDHYSYGSAGDGRRIVKTTRPKEFTPEEWKSLGHEHRKALAEEFRTAGIDVPPSEDEKKKLHQREEEYSNCRERPQSTIRK